MLGWVVRSQSCGGCGRIAKVVGFTGFTKKSVLD